VSLTFTGSPTWMLKSRDISWSTSRPVGSERSAAIAALAVPSRKKASGRAAVRGKLQASIAAMSLVSSPKRALPMWKSTGVADTTPGTRRRSAKPAGWGSSTVGVTRRSDPTTKPVSAAFSAS
jgi:hypothetical protein